LLLFVHYCGISARMGCDVPITRKPQVADPELWLALLKKVACGSERDGGSCLSVASAGRDQQSAERGSRNKSRE
jgi:hypothetical protein